MGEQLVWHEGAEGSEQIEPILKLLLEKTAGLSEEHRGWFIVDGRKAQDTYESALQQVPSEQKTERLFMESLRSGAELHIPTAMILDPANRDLFELVVPARKTLLQHQGWREPFDVVLRCAGWRHNLSIFHESAGLYHMYSSLVDGIIFLPDCEIIYMEEVPAFYFNKEWNHLPRLSMVFNWGDVDILSDGRYDIWEQLHFQDHQKAHLEPFIHPYFFYHEANGTKPNRYIELHADFFDRWNSAATHSSVLRRFVQWSIMKTYGTACGSEEYVQDRLIKARRLGLGLDGPAPTRPSCETGGSQPDSCRAI